MLIPDRLLLAVCAFGADMPAGRAAETLAKGVRAAGMPEPDLCPVGDGLPGDFNVRMRSARAVIVGAGRLDRETLAGSAVFEIATRARQAGVPAYGVTGANELDAFDARMLDLQMILQASDARALQAAGGKLAALIGGGTPTVNSGSRGTSRSRGCAPPVRGGG
jgi:glycerate kinase